MYDPELDFDITPMKKRDLAQLYAPDLTPRAAVNRLREWIDRHPILTAELAKCGYRKTARVFTAKQVRLIITYLGEP